MPASMPTNLPPRSGRPRVGLFVTCLVDLLRPSIGFAAATLIERSGCDVEVPASQTCCGQPAYNSGDRADTKALARQTIQAFAGVDYVVAPSGSCAGMLKSHYPRLFAGEGEDEAAALAFAGKVHELVSFLVDVRGMTSVESPFAGRVTYHDSCSGLRELGIKDQPRKLLGAMPGVEIAEMAEAEICCGFGGTFSIKYPDISRAMVDKKCASIAESGASLVLAGDLGCLMNMAGRLARDGSSVRCRHVAEVLAGELADPPITSAATSDGDLKR